MSILETITSTASTMQNSTAELLNTLGSTAQNNTLNMSATTNSSSGMLAVVRAASEQLREGSPTIFLVSLGVVMLLTGVAVYRNLEALNRYGCRLNLFGTPMRDRGYEAIPSHSDTATSSQQRGWRFMPGASSV